MLLCSLSTARNRDKVRPAEATGLYKQSWTKKGYGAPCLWRPQIPQRFSCCQQEISQSVVLLKKKRRAPASDAEISEAPEGLECLCKTLLPSFHGPNSLPARLGLPPLFCPPFFLFWAVLPALRLPPLWIWGVRSIYFLRFRVVEDEMHLRSHTSLLWVIFRESCVLKVLAL